MNYRLLSILCVALSISMYAQGELLSTESSAELSSPELSIELSDDVDTPLVPEKEIVIFNEQKQPESSSLISSLSQYSFQQIAALVAGSLIVGYSAYKAYQMFVAWYFPYSIELTAKQRDILLMLTETMKQDVKQARMGNRKPSLVKGLDVSGLGTPLDIECRYWQQNFVMLYNQCETNSEAIDMLNAFYMDFNQAIQDLINKARIV